MRTRVLHISDPFLNAWMAVLVKAGIKSSLAINLNLLKADTASFQLFFRSHLRERLSIRLDLFTKFETIAHSSMNFTDHLNLIAIFLILKNRVVIPLAFLLIITKIFFSFFTQASLIDYLYKIIWEDSTFTNWWSHNIIIVIELLLLLIIFLLKFLSSSLASCWLFTSICQYRWIFWDIDRGDKTLYLLCVNIRFGL